MRRNISLQPPLDDTADPLSVDVARLLQASIAPNTAKAYGDALRKLFEHLDGQPLTDATLAGYLAHMHARGLAPASVTVAVQAVRFWEKLEHRPSSVGADDDPGAGRDPPGGSRPGPRSGNGIDPRDGQSSWYRTPSVPTPSPD